jgi:hypothetical protein
LYNILQLGLLEKMDNVFGRNINEKSIWSAGHKGKCYRRPD